MPVTRRVPGNSTRSAGRTALPTLVGIEEIADHLGVTVRHVRRLVAERRIPYFKWGHLLRFDRDQIGTWVAGTRVDPVLYGVARHRRGRP